MRTRTQRGTRGFNYKDKDLDPVGLGVIVLRAGAAGKSRVVVKGKGALLGAPTPPLATPVTVQLRNGLDRCWTATYSTPVMNADGQFKAKAD